MPRNENAAPRRARKRLSGKVFLSPQKPASSPRTPLGDRSSHANMTRGNMPSSGRKSEALRALSANQLLDLYSNVIKLSTENKINAKNTWNLHLIDHMDDVLDTQTQTKEFTNFMAASAALEAGMKIYSSRVDSVHTDIYKVLGGLNRTDEKGDGDEDEFDQDGNPKRKKRSRKFVDTIEANIANLNLKKVDLNYDVDPLFHKTSAAFDEGGAKGMLLNSLHVHQGCNIVFSSSAVENDDNVAEADTSTVDLSSMAAPLSQVFSRIPSSGICPSFDEFVRQKNARLNDIRIGGGANVGKVNATTRESIASVRQSMGAHSVGGALANDDLDDDDFDDIDTGMLDEPDLDAADWQETQMMHDIAGDADSDDEGGAFDGDDGPSGAAQQQHGQQRQQWDITEIAKSLADTGNQFCYLDPRLMSNWAGMSHWKAGRKKKDAAQGGDKSGAATKPKKSDFFFDFTQAVDDAAFDEATSHKRAATVLSEAALKKHVASENIQPEDLHYTVASLMQLFVKPSQRVTMKRRLPGGSGQGAAGSGDWYRLEEDEGTANNHDDDSDDDDFAGGFGGFNMDDSFGAQSDARMSSSTTMSMPVYEEDGLIDAPKQVEKININYARVAKTMDVGALKTSLWRDLVTESAEDRDAVKKTKPAERVVGETQQFSDVITKLPSYAPPSLMKNVSVPYCFICLLHLANEHSLKLEDQEDLSELRITQD